MSCEYIEVAWYVLMESLIKTLNMGAIIDGARLVSVNVNTYALNFDCLFHI